MTWESQPDAALHGDLAAAASHEVLSATLRSLIAERARLLELITQVDREIDRVRGEATDDARRAAERLRDAS